MRPSVSAVILAVLVASSGCLAGFLPTEVVELDDSDFEHDTQASSGQTTGVWVVLFTAPTVRGADRLDKMFEDLAADEEKEAVIATVDLSTSKELAGRFSRLFLPAVVIFRNRKMYVYEGSLSKEDTADALHKWIAEGYEQDTPQEVPAVYKRLTMEDMDIGKPSGQQRNWNSIYLGLGCILVAAIFRTYIHLERQKEEDKKKAQAEAKITAVIAAGQDEGEGAAAAGAKPIRRKA